MSRHIHQEIEFEDEEQIIHSLKIIKSEYLKKAIKAFVIIVIVLVIYLIYLLLCYRPNIFFNNDTLQLSTFRQYSFNLTTGWAFFSISVFIVIYLIKIIRLKFTPSLIYFIKKEITNIGFEFKKRYTSNLLFIMLNTGAIAILLYVDFGVIQFEGNPYGHLLQIIIILYLLISLGMPITWIFINDKFLVKLKPNFYILFDFHYRIRKKDGYNSNLVGIYLTSNRLCSRFDRFGKQIHNKISKVRWLPQKGKTKIELNPYLYFREFSVPLNFQKQFLNIALALKEWEENYFQCRHYHGSPYLDLNSLKMKLLLKSDYPLSIRLVR